MKPMDWDELKDRIFVAYGEASYREALELVLEARSLFPERDSTLTRFEACLLSLCDEPRNALDVLEAGMERGMFWHPRMLADPDLDAIREIEGWEDFESRSAAVAERHAANRPAPLIRDAPSPLGTMVALHGAGDVPADFFAEWVADTPPEWTVVAPVGDVPMSDIRWAWPFDTATDSLVETLDAMSLTKPIVLSGYSQGARIAAEAAWNGLIDAAGLILSAAGLQPEVWENSKKRLVPMYLVVGTKDYAYEPSIALEPLLRDADVPVILDVREGLGHVPPDDLDVVIATGLDWITSQV